jgi:hypothetical protein
MICFGISAEKSERKVDKSAMSKNARWRPNSSQSPAQLAVANRLVEIKSNPFEAARAADLPRTFVYEFLTGKKVSFRGESLSKFADALKWSVSELAAIVSEGGGPEKAVADPVDRLVVEAAFLGLMRLFRPDIEDEPALLELFRTLAAMKQDPRSSAPLVDQMFFRAQISSRRFAPQ